ncbi:class I adenylate-forming enzyme family protein [Nocardia sp. XZ_19_385]|uniref:class I adenylate-forming enzyme family protein n=1 Tax=Nocardia sp. XZ_19_385 TaxID=2769488 RepID=UPI00188EDD56|nr:AMP-binding protein [Nocardia sp. XZ_19_385]
MPTIDATLRMTARRVPGREALVFGDIRRTYAELDAEVDRVAGVLAERGITKGDRVALMATNSDRFVIAFYAAHRLGAIFVPINPASAAPELDYLLRDSGAAALIFDAVVEPAVRKAAAIGLPGSLQLFAMSDLEGHQDLFALAADYDGPPVEVEIAESDDAQILYTSGTTGSPKGALFDHHRVLCVTTAVIGTCGMADNDRLLHVAPLYHAAELCIMLIPGTLLGATHIVHSGFDPAEVLETLESERITMFFGVPTMYQFLLRMRGAADRDLSAWRTGMFGAAPMPATVVEQLVTTWPTVNFTQLCGQTEGGPGGIFANRDQVRERPDASGRQALILMECRVVDENGADVAPGEVGELLLRGETVMKGYWNKPEATADTIRDGWLHTGDLTRLDADGYMTLVDRLKDMIITGGRNVYSIEVENAIAAHPDVVDCAVIARPHAEYGESIVAFATLKDGAALTLESLREFCVERIAGYKLPHDLVLTAQIPRNPSGKVLKRTLREQFIPAGS